MILYVQDATTATSAESRPIVDRARGEREDVHVVAYGDFGGGSAGLEYRTKAGTWIPLTDTVVTEPSVQIVDLWAGAVIRVVVTDATSVTVEIH